MAVRTDFTAGEVLAAADLNDTFASKPPFAYGTATPSTTVEGFIWYDENDTPPAPKFWDGAAFETFGGGKILQVVRATDTTDRSTTSTSFVDVTGMSVTITPQKSTSAVIIIAIYAAYAVRSGNASEIQAQITDASNNSISGAENAQVRMSGLGLTSSELKTLQNLWAYDTPAVTTAKTYKLRFRSELSSMTSEIRNATNTGQMYAIEVSA